MYVCVCVYKYTYAESKASLDDRPKSAELRSVCFGSSKPQLPSSCLHLFPRYGCSWRKRVVTWESIQISRKGVSCCWYRWSKMLFGRWPETLWPFLTSRWLQQSLPKSVAVRLLGICMCSAMPVSNKISALLVTLQDWTLYGQASEDSLAWAVCNLGCCGIVLASTLFHFCGTSPPCLLPLALTLFILACIWRESNWPANTLLESVLSGVGGFSC